MHPIQRLPPEVWTYIMSLCTPLDLVHLLSADRQFASFLQNLNREEWLQIVKQMWGGLHCKVELWTEHKKSEGAMLWIRIPNAPITLNKIEERCHLLRYLLTIDRTQQKAIESMLKECVYLRECPKYPTIPFDINYMQDQQYPSRLYDIDVLNHLNHTLSIVLPLDFLNFLLNFSCHLGLKQPYLPWNSRFTNFSFLFFGPEDTWQKFRLLNPDEYIDPDFLGGEPPSHVLHNRRNPELNAEWRIAKRKLLVISQSSSGDRLLMDVTHPDCRTFGWIYAHSNHPLVFNTRNPQFLDFSITDLLCRIISNDQMMLKTTWFHNLFDKPNLGAGSLFSF